MTFQMSLADLRTLLKENVVEGKIGENGLSIDSIKQRVEELDKSKLTVKELSELPFLELLKIRNVYHITFDKEKILDDKAFVTLSKISQSNTYALVVKHDKHYKDKIIMVIGNVCNFSFEESQNSRIIESAQGQQI